eukprot:2988071-Alexandrium_andersonii.AAC.1
MASEAVLGVRGGGWTLSAKPHGVCVCVKGGNPLDAETLERVSSETLSVCPNPVTVNSKRGPQRTQHHCGWSRP